MRMGIGRRGGASGDGEGLRDQGWLAEGGITVLKAMRIRAGPGREGRGLRGGPALATPLELPDHAHPGSGPRLLELLGQRSDVLHAVLVRRQVAFQGLVAPH